MEIIFLHYLDMSFNVRNFGVQKFLWFLRMDLKFAKLNAREKNVFFANTQNHSKFHIKVYKIKIRQLILLPNLHNSIEKVLHGVPEKCPAPEKLQPHVGYLFV